MVSPILLVIWSFGIDKQDPIRDFFVGVEYVYVNSDVKEVKAFVDRFKNFTNLFVAGFLDVTLNVNNPNQVCDNILMLGSNFWSSFSISSMKRVIDTLTTILTSGFWKPK